MGQFGEKLRKQREQRGVTLDAVSNTTKISTRMLKALEDERFDQLPGGVFNKGFVRAYARQIGLDAEEAVSDYLDALRESQAQALAIMPDFRALRQESVEPSKATVPAGGGVSPPDVHAGVSRDVSKDVRQDPHPPMAPRQDARPPAAPEAQLQKTPERVPAERPRKKLIEERPARPNFQPAVRIPWGIVAAGLLVIALLLAFLSYHPRRARSAASTEPARESQIAAATQPEKPAGQSVDTLPAASGATSPASSGSASSSGTPASTSAASRLPSVGTSLNASGTAGSSSGTTPAPSAAVPTPAAPASSRPLAQSSSTDDLPESSSTNSPVSPGQSSQSSAGPLAPSGVSAPPSGASASSSTTARALSTPKSTTPDASSSTPHSATATPSPLAARAKAPSTFTLLIRAEETSSVSITADGKPVAQETLIAPAGTSVRAAQEIVVRAGNAAGLVFVLNGKTLPRQGQPGEARTFLFDANGVHIIVPSGPSVP